MIVFGCMEENVVKKTCGGTRLEIDIRKDEIFFLSKCGEAKKSLKFLFWNLTPCKVVHSKPEALYCFKSKSDMS